MLDEQYNSDNVSDDDDIVNNNKMISLTIRKVNLLYEVL